MNPFASRPVHQLAGGLALLAALASHATAQPLAQVADGALQGITAHGVHQYLGIPYAQAPVGDLRWTAPRPAPAWSGLRDATRFSPDCPQLPDPFAGKQPEISEDCLTLNVYVPGDASTTPRPVIVWIPGGGAVLGSGRQYDAYRMAQATGAVVVTINYRLGALGWLWTSGMAAEAQGSNFALQDQQEALRWVQRNIAGLQGDPRRVTLAGQSVGSISAALHLVSPTAAGLFQRVILASGLPPAGMPTSAQAADKGDAFATKVGCPPGTGQLACLRHKPVADLLQAGPSYADIGRDGLYWLNFIDGRVVTGDVAPAVAKGRFNQVPILVGSTRDEGRGFAPLAYDLDGTPMTQDEYVAAAGRTFGTQAAPLLTQLMYTSARLGSPGKAYAQLITDAWFACPSQDLARKATAHVPTFAYEFADPDAPEFLGLPTMDSGAFHASDLLYWFQTPIDGAPLTLDPAQRRLSDQMLRYWKRFAEAGDPNASGASNDVAWPRFNTLTTPVLTLVPDQLHLQQWGQFQRAHQCGAWALLNGLQSLTRK